MESRRVERRFPRDIGALDAIFAFTAEFLGSHAIDAERAFEIDLVLEELFTNMVRHAPEGAEDVAIAMEWATPVLTIVFRDHGAAPFDPTQAPEVDITRPIGERRPGGLGIHLVRRISDSFTYHHDNGVTTLTLTKRLEP